MKSSMCLLAGLGAMVWGLAGRPASAQEDPVLAHQYGSGVHAFFDGDYTKAYEDLTAAIDGGTEDPRVYYFRALVFLRTGRPEMAKMDMDVGAGLELADIAGRFPVSTSLERVQGRDRMQLEDHRQVARLTAFERNQQIQQQLYEEAVIRQDEVLRRALEVPLEGFATDDEAPPIPPPPAAAEVRAPADPVPDFGAATNDGLAPVDPSEEPLGDRGAPIRPAPIIEPTGPITQDGAIDPAFDPFNAPATTTGDDAPLDSADLPLGDRGAPIQPAPINEPADPFSTGGLDGAAAEPLTPPTTPDVAPAEPLTPPPAAAPPATTPPAADSNPFAPLPTGGVPATTTPPAETTPPAANSDPFGGPPPANPAAGADPFAAPPATTTPPATAPPAADNDPFGGPPPPANPPAATPPAADPPAAGAAPADTAPTPDVDDPFAP
jgi:hypothetical protein